LFFFFPENKNIITEYWVLPALRARLFKLINTQKETLRAITKANRSFCSSSKINDQ
jgi:hypothetical protein